MVQVVFELFEGDIQPASKLGFASAHCCCFPRVQSGIRIFRFPRLEDYRTAFREDLEIIPFLKTQTFANLFGDDDSPFLSKPADPGQYAPFTAAAPGFHAIRLSDERPVKADAVSTSLLFPCSRFHFIKSALEQKVS